MNVSKGRFDGVLGEWRILFHMDIMTFQKKEGFYFNLQLHVDIRST